MESVHMHSSIKLLWEEKEEEQNTKEKALGIKRVGLRKGIRNRCRDTTHSDSTVVDWGTLNSPRISTWCVISLGSMVAIWQI